MRFLIPLLVVATILQSLTLPGLTANGVRPDLALVLVVGWAWIRGWEEGVIAGAIGGLMIDIASTTPFGINIFRLTVLGLIAGLVMDRLARTGAALPIAAGVGGCALAFVLTIVGLQAAGWTVDWERALTTTAIPSGVLTVLCMVAATPFFRAVERRIASDELGPKRSE
ncbi:MAG TPA: rod shape-determining protein MreD [Chloroflexota bacterium]|nr:rod shape-determining protein MreD [Chloroflexota bacterium]